MGMDNVLAHVDQASVHAWRSIGRGPVVQFTWIYDRPVDMDRLRMFTVRLGRGLLGRIVERSVLPFGRDRWVLAPMPAELEISGGERLRTEVRAWADERVRLPVNPYDRAWHLGVQPLSGGGAAVSLVVSHCVGDAKAITLAISEAARVVDRDLRYPMPGSRSTIRSVVEDLGQAARDLPAVAKALISLTRAARSTGERRPPGSLVRAEGARVGRDAAGLAPSATAYIDAGLWDERAGELGGTANTLFAAVAARLGRVLGRLGPDGSARLSFPVSEREPRDTRANALTEVTIVVDPLITDSDLSGVRRDLKRSLSALSRSPNPVMGSLALAPYVPATLVRRLEMRVHRAGRPIGCSNIGRLEPAVNRPDGTDADTLAWRMMEPGLTPEILDQSDGLLFLAAARVRGQVCVTVASWVPGGRNTGPDLRAALGQALRELSVTATID